MLVKMFKISKLFGPVLANDCIDFSIGKSEIVGLLGENGAGKTTLMNILYGIYPPDKGRIVIGEKRVFLKSPRDAIRHRIGMVHQHFMLIPSFTVLENVVFGTGGERFFGNSTAAVQEVERLAAEYGLSVNLNAVVDHLSVGQQQQVEILKVLYRDARVLVFDEPTAVLTPQEADSLFSSMRAMAAAGRAIIFITHKLNEVFSVSTRLVVLQRGSKVFQADTAATDKAEVSQAMVKQKIVKTRLHSTDTDRAEDEDKEVILKVDKVSAKNHQGLPALNKVSFCIHSGEILGIAGVSGNGQTELAEVIAKLRPVTQGAIYLQGEDIGRKPASWVKDRVAHIPESRLAMGIAPSMTVGENLALKSYPKFCFAGRLLRRRALADWSETLVSQFKIDTPTVRARVANLSGGNLQRIVLARELSGQAKMVIAAYPTRGLDIAAAEYARQMLLSQRKVGNAILLISEDLDELFSLSDRIAVFYEGRIMRIALTSELSIKEVGQMMMGQLPQQTPVKKAKEA